MLLNDAQIRDWEEYPIIDPFVPVQEGKPSYGLGSFGYDIRLGAEYLEQRQLPGFDLILDPKKKVDSWMSMTAKHGEIILYPGTMILAESFERFRMPGNVFATVEGKSSYARLGLLVNVTPLEPGWEGVLTMALSNVGAVPVRLHVGQGIAQVSFWQGETPLRGYTQKEAGGSYQGQTKATPI